jgi:Cu2+-exporting ATPase
MITVESTSPRVAVQMEESCFHCGLPVSRQDNFALDIEGKTRKFCCAGCQAVAELIHSGGLDQFYQFRSEFNRKPDHQETEYKVYDRLDIQQEFVKSNSLQQRTAYLLLDSITCTACVWLIEKYMQEVKGVININVNSVTHQCVLTWNSNIESLSGLMKKLANLGYPPHPYTQQQHQQQQDQNQKQMLLRLGLAGFAMMQVGMVAIALYAGALQGIEQQWVQLLRWVSLLVATPVVLFSAQPFWMAAWRSLKPAFSLKPVYLTMDVPVSIAILLAYVASAWATIQQTGEVYFDSISMFTFFLLLGRYLEMRLRYRNQQQTGNMMQILPMTVTQVNDNQQTVVPLSELSVGDCVRVHSGETIPCDGCVLEGKSAVTEAVLTGEVKPVMKQQGDKVIAGTVNTDGSLLIEVTAVGEATRLSTIAQLVEEAALQKPKIQTIADRVASYFVFAVLVISASVYLIWHSIDSSAALWVTLSVLVVTCPCALSLATPTALTASLAIMRKHGVLVLKNHVVESLTQIKKVIFDKTGTLTYGEPEITRVTCLDRTLNKKQVLAIAAALEEGSSHPIAKAFVNYSGEKTAKEHRIETGAGVSGVVEGTHYRLGKPSYVLGEGAKNLTLPQHGQWLLLAQQQALSSTKQSSASKPSKTKWQAIAWIGLSDRLRSSAVVAINGLQDQNIDSEMLSGDSEAVVKSLAKRLGLGYLSAQSPEQKLTYLKNQQQRAPVMMVGDGINDVPVLAAANVSVAMDSASDFARTRADMVLVDGNLSELSRIIQLAQKTKNIIRQNLGWALAYNLTVLPLAAMGYIPPYLAAIGMSLSSLIVVCNALRLYR